MSIAKLTNHANFFLIAGPCAVESKELVFETASTLKTICNRLDIPFVFKASYKKANRTRLDSFTGIGNEKAMQYLSAVKNELNVLVTTDVHSPEEAKWASQYVDILQIPAFLCRQTDLLVAAAQTGKIVNIKKGQFAGPSAMQFAIEKVKNSVEDSEGNSGGSQVWLTERGTTFGYQDLVVDFRGIPQMQSFEVPVIMDCTHSLQQPNQSVGVTGGQPKMISTIARAAVAVGADGLFIETHPEPAKALSDGANMLPLDQIESLLEKLVKIRKAVIE